MVDARSTLLAILHHPTRPGPAAQSHESEPQEGTLLRPPEPKAVGSNPALPVSKSFRRLDLPQCPFPAGEADGVTV